MTDTPQVTIRSIPSQLQSRLSLHVIGDGHFMTHPLPDAGDIVIGRIRGCDVVIDDASISRRHAIIHLGPPLTIEDLASANGTRVRDAWLTPNQPTPITPGEVVDIGSLMILIQDRSTKVLRQRRMWAHGDFEARVDEECRRAERTNATFAIAEIACGAAISPKLVQQLLDEVVRGSDVVGQYAPSEYEVLLVDCAPAEAGALGRRIEAALSDRGVPSKIGVACYPRDGRDPYSLIARAIAASRAPVPSEAPTNVVVEGAMQQLQRLAAHVAAGKISVLVLGETGVGKEVLAETIHQLSPRAEKPFVRLNCAALTESLLESELFGHERGAFTGAVVAKPGLLETAEGGTVFLDAVGELPQATQVKLLRVLETRQVLRVGALKPRPIDVRFVSATNRDLEAEVARGAFRQDLFFRLNGVSLVIPPLRQRVGEIAGLARAFVEQAANQMGQDAPLITPAAMALLERYEWPGNIRELRNVIERAVLLCGGASVDVPHLPIEKMRPTPPNNPPPIQTPSKPRRVPTNPPLNSAMGLADEIEKLERQRIVEALEKCVGNQTKAAKMLGISRRTLTNRMNAFKLPRPRKESQH
jgi:two-component system, NtrC family, response regulator AtoC